MSNAKTMSDTKKSKGDDLREKLFDMLESEVPYYLRKRFSGVDEDGEDVYLFPVSPEECDEIIASVKVDIVSIRSQLEASEKYSGGRTYDPGWKQRTVKAFGGKVQCVGWLELYRRLLAGGKGNSPAEIVDEMTKDNLGGETTTDARVRDLEYQKSKLEKRLVSYQRDEFAAKMCVLEIRDESKARGSITTKEIDEIIDDFCPYVLEMNLESARNAWERQNRG